MAVSKSSQLVTWSASSTTSITSGSTATSDAMSTDATCYGLEFECKADNAGTPASGDYVTIYVLPTLGDPDGTGSDEYATTTSGKVIGILSTYQSGVDPAMAVFSYPGHPPKGYKIYAVSSAASNSITFSVRDQEKRA